MPSTTLPLPELGATDNQSLIYVINLYPYKVTVGRDNSSRAYYVDVVWEISNSNIWKKFWIPESKIHTLANPESEMVNLVGECLSQFTNDLGWGQTGDYPFARIWHDKHDKGLSKLFGRPHTTIPGWVFPKFKKSKDYPEDLGKADAHSHMVGNFNIESAEEFNPVAPNPDVPEHPRVERIKREAEEKKAREEEKNKLAEWNKVATWTERPKNQNSLERAMAKSAVSKKRRVVVKAPIKIDPSKVKPPDCAIHGFKMLYSKITERWECTYEGCTQVARPKRDPDDRDLVFGKGDVELRLVTQGGETSVILISSDNVALDITKFVDVQKLIEESDAVTLAEAATESSTKDSFLITSDQTVEIKSNVVIIGANDFLKTHSKG